MYPSPIQEEIGELLPRRIPSSFLCSAKYCTGKPRTLEEDLVVGNRALVLAFLVLIDFSLYLSLNKKVKMNRVAIVLHG